MEDNHNLLLKPSTKKTSLFKKEYPFPIISNDIVEENQHDPSWKCVEGFLQDKCVLVHDEESMKLLYKKGFYGKGTLSKNAPQVCFKKQRPGDKCIEKGEKSKRPQSSGPSRDCPDEDIICVEDSLDEMPNLKTDVDNVEIEVVLSDSNSSLDDSSTKLKKNLNQSDSAEKESLQLTFEEAYFLSYGLGCLIVKDKDQPLNLTRLWNKLCELSGEKNFPVMYAAYHHFRSKGWIVKCGLKYGVDYVLYKDGPPFNHATYSVIVKYVKEQGMRDVRGQRQLTWGSLAAINRVNSTAGKALMFLYVIKPHQVSESKIVTPFCLSQFKLEEVLIKRWVPSEGREENDLT